MSITYEEALSTLTSMFGSPWTEETLDAVLRHHEGHMENTVESVLGHGDGDPQALVDRLKDGPKNDASVSMDEELARQLENEERNRGNGRRAPTASSQPTAQAPKPKGRGTPTDLPPDFLRIPGYNPTAAGGTDADERLARMLQDELFSRELANNPEFAHLSRGRPRTSGGMPVSSRGSARQHRNSQGRVNGEGPQIMEKLSEMGENAKKKLTMLAAQWNSNARRNSANAPSGGSGGPSGAASEQRGLLDGDGDDDGFSNPREMELSSSPMGFGSKKQM